MIIERNNRIWLPRTEQTAELAIKTTVLAKLTVPEREWVEGKLATSAVSVESA